MILIYVLVAVFLLFLNAFFVLAEFASVKVRPTQVEALVDKGNRRARTLQHIQAHLDEFLSVCQVGITLASVGLGFVGEPAFAELLLPLIRSVGISGAALPVTAHSVSVVVAYLLVSFLHIVLGELLPKSLALRSTERTALFTAYPLRIFRYVFIAPMWLLNGSVTLLLKLLRISPASGKADHSEEEVRIILDQSQSSGMLSLRRLLLMENVLDLGALTVRNAMRGRRIVRTVSLAETREQVLQVFREFRHSRYPVIGDDPDRPIGYLHIKELLLNGEREAKGSDLRHLVKPCLQFKESDALEQRLSEMQRKGAHMALVYAGTGAWTGILTLEDGIEEVIGTVEEEYPTEPTVRLSDSLTPSHTLLDTEGSSILSATRSAIQRIPGADLPVSRDAIMLSVAERERLGSSYVGKRLAIPHARLSRLAAPMVIVARMRVPMPSPVVGEDINLLFILLTPSDTPRIHQILLSHIAGIFESDFLEGKLEEAATPAELYNAIVTAEQVVLG